MTYGAMRGLCPPAHQPVLHRGQPGTLYVYLFQADLLRRIPALLRDGVQYVTTTVRRIRAVAELAAPEVKGEILLYDLPEDLFQLLGGLIHLSPEGLVRYHGHQLLGGRRVAIPRRDQGTYYAEYFRYPHLPLGTPADDAPLDCPPEALGAVAYYAASHLVMEDNSFLYAAHARASSSGALPGWRRALTPSSAPCRTPTGCKGEWPWRAHPFPIPPRSG